MLKDYKQDSDEKMKKLSEYFKTMFVLLSVQINKSNQINTLSSSPNQKDTSTPPDPTTVVPDNRRDPPSEGGHYTKVGGMWNLKHKISSPMYKAVKKTKFIRRYMEALALHTGEPTVNWEYNTSCIYVVEDKIVTPRVQHIDIPVYFLLDQFDNGLYLPKYEMSSVMPDDMYT